MLHDEINSRSKTKPIVFVYHSFGTYILIQYFKFYSSSRVVGLIDLGGAPIRFYPLFKTVYETYSQLDWQFIVENIDAITNRFNKIVSKMNSNYSLSSQ
jgi:predicted alpha/beta hydrolase family esterase